MKVLSLHKSNRYSGYTEFHSNAVQSIPCIISHFMAAASIPSPEWSESVLRPNNDSFSDFSFSQGEWQVQSYVDELLQILVKTCEIIFSLFVLGDQSLLLFEQNLSFLLKSFPFGIFVVDPSCHYALLIFLGVLGILFEELLDGYER